MVKLQTVKLSGHAMQTYSGLDVYFCSVFTRRLMEVSGEHHAPAALLLGKNPVTH